MVNNQDTKDSEPMLYGCAQIGVFYVQRKNIREHI